MIQFYEILFQIQL